MPTCPVFAGPVTYYGFICYCIHLYACLKKYFLFIKIYRVIVTQVGFCVISPWSLSRSFQTTKWPSYDGYSIYIVIFKLFHEAVYPAGVTTNRSITPVLLIGFAPHLMLEFAFGLPFCVLNFKEIGVHVWVYSNFCKCAKTRRRRRIIIKRKNEEKNQNFGSSYLKNGLRDFFQIWYVDTPGWPATVQQI